MNFKSDKENVAGWIAVGITTLFASFWAFWGIVENFHEGWYYESFWMNVGLMAAQYLPWAFGFIILGSVALTWPRIGGVCFMVAAIALPLLWVRTSAAVLFITVPLAVVGILYWFGRPHPVKWGRRILVVLPVVVWVSFGIEPASRVAGRYDDGNYGAQLIEGNGLHLIWAPEGPGWPSHSSQVTNLSWNEAKRICAHLTNDGLALTDSPQNIWRLPTVDELVRSLVRHGTNAGGVWDRTAEQATFKIMPDKESPLWRVHSPIIYWWTSTEVNDSTAYRVVYNGGVHALPKKMTMGDLGFRAVMQVVNKPDQNL